MTLAAGRRWKATLSAAATAVAVAGLGALSTDLGGWYQSLQQPGWKPPDWAFGPIWTVIFALTALAGLKALDATPDRRARRVILAALLLNGVLNILWSLLFFRLRRPDWALVEVGFLWASVALLIVVLGRHSRTAGVLLVPYLVWVSLAAALNAAVVRLNGPFGGG